MNNKITIVIMIVTLILLTGCQEKETLKVGVIAPMTGPASSLGEHFMNGFNLIENEHLEIFVEDSKSNPAETITAAQKFVNVNNVDLIITLQASVSVPLAGYTEDKVPLLGTIISDESFTRDYENTYNLFPLPEEEVGESLNFIELKKYKTAAVLTLNDKYGKSMNREFVQSYKGQVLANEEYGMMNKDISTQLLKIKNANPEVVYFIGYPGHVVRFIETYKKLGIDIPVVSSMQLQGEYVKDQVGELLEDNMYSVTPTSTLNNTNNSEFITTYKTQYGKNPDWAAPFGYDLALVLKEISSADELTKVEVNGLNGKVVFNEYGESKVPLVTIRAKDKTKIN